jgi:hypothetical protein
MVSDMTSFPAQAHPLDAIIGRTSKTALTNWRRQPLVLEGKAAG